MTTITIDNSASAKAAKNVCYPFLAGFLESALRNIAADDSFLECTTNEERSAYLEKVIKRANDLSFINPEN